MLFAPGRHEVTAHSGKSFIVRPACPDDETALAEMLACASPQDIRFRVLGTLKDFPHLMARRLTRLDPDRETTLLGVADDRSPPEILGVVHVVVEPNSLKSAEFDVMVRADLKGQGIGYLLMVEILDHARQRGLDFVEGYIARENRTMLTMSRELGFRLTSMEDGVVQVSVDLRSAEAARALEALPAMHPRTAGAEHRSASDPGSRRAFAEAPHPAGHPLAPDEDSASGKA